MFTRRLKVDIIETCARLTYQTYGRPHALYHVSRNGHLFIYHNVVVSTTRGDLFQEGRVALPILCEFGDGTEPREVNATIEVQSIGIEHDTPQATVRRMDS